MAITHTVIAGDTVGALAKQFNVPVSAITGFRSNDPNVIFPGEQLTIDDSQVLAPIQPQQPAEVLPEAPEQPVSNVVTQPIVEPQTEPEQPVTEVPGVTEAEITERRFGVEPAVSPEEPEIFTTPSGAEVTEVGEVISLPEEEERAEGFFGQFGISAQEVKQGFLDNPFGTIGDLVSQVMQATGLPDIRSNITNISNEIEKLENERDAEIERINDNPFISAGTTRASHLRQRGTGGRSTDSYGAAYN